MTEAERDWNSGNVRSLGRGCFIVMDRLQFYVSGRSRTEQFWDGGSGSTGLGTLRRDGFASMDASEARVTLTTRPVRFSGQHLFVKAEAREGRLSAELLNEDQEVIQPFTCQKCAPLTADNTCHAIQWGMGAICLSSPAVRSRSRLNSGQSYTVWVSSDGMAPALVMWRQGGHVSRVRGTHAHGLCTARLPER